MNRFFLGLTGVLGFSSESFAQGYGGWGMGPGMMGWGMGYGMGWLWAVLMVVFWIAVIVGIVFLIRWLILSTKTPSQHGRQEESALDILKKRYARGEIDKEEFEQRKKDLLS
jgi:putative membrane protein